MAKMQRQWKTGTVYTVRGPAQRQRKLKLVGRGKVHGKEVLLFQQQRKANKFN